MFSPLIAPADHHDGADATFPSAIGAGERLTIRIDAPRKKPRPGVAAGQGPSSSATAIRIIIDHLGRAVDVSPPTAHLLGHLERSASPRKGPAIHGSDADSNSSSLCGSRGAFARSDGDDSSSRNGRVGAISRPDGDRSSRIGSGGRISRSGGDMSNRSRSNRIGHRSDGDDSSNDLEEKQEILEELLEEQQRFPKSVF